MQQAAVKAQHRRLLRRDVQLEGRRSLFYFLSKSLRVFSVPERCHEVVGVPGEFRPSWAALFEAPFKPQVQDVVQIHVRQHG
jgi:hypothetical protein